MPDINQVLFSSTHYKQAFEEGLSRILQHKTAGTFILACANLFQHPEFLKNNRVQLNEAYTCIKQRYQAYQKKGQQPDDAPDDITVMTSLIDIGLHNLQDVEYRKIEFNDVDFLLNYNQLRSFRPARMSTADNLELDMPFNEDGFHFDKPFLAKESFAEGECEGKQLSLLYNKFPFIHYHALLVVDKARHNNQYLTQDTLNYIVRLHARTQQNCPDFVMTYNSLGAGASVNHLHFHTYIQITPLPVFSQAFGHNGGKLPYPASCLVLNSATEAWKIIETLQKNNMPYNLLFKNKKIYCLPRKIADKEYVGMDVNTYGWSQMAGLINVENGELLDEITADKVISSLKSVSATI